MKRAVLWLCWGEKFIREAAESARSAAAIGADRFLITDMDGAAFARRFTEFDSVIPMRPVHGNNLEKSRLIEFLPDGYDTFLFLDTDTRIIGDIELGFDKAVRHGIAMAPAPNYNLGEFAGFGEIMQQLGHEPADQMLYNSGVIFFHRSAVVLEVLELWRDLCADAGPRFNFPRDQPFLTLAFERLGFVPYVLSPLYNYRGLGEHAVGNIRLWHSHFALPPNVNVFENAWPARRYRDGILLGSAEEQPEQAPAPRGMLQIPLPKLAQRLSPEAARTIATDTLAVQHNRGSRVANEFFLEQTGLEGSPDNNESYYAEALHYHLGLLHAYALDPAEMTRHMRLSKTMPTGEDDQIYSDHVNLSRVLRSRQLHAIRRGLPPVLMACMPRSASATLAYTISRALDISAMHLSAGRFPDYFLIAPWLDTFIEGGAITQDHFGASAFNLGVLRARDVRDVFVLIRDPRAAARSQVHFLAGQRGSTREPPGSRIARECMSNFLPWLQGWIDCAKDQETPFRIHWLTWREVSRDPGALLQKISGILAAEYPAIAPFAEARSIEPELMHFVNGDDHAWEAEVSPQTRDALWEACTADMRALLDLKR